MRYTGRSFFRAAVHMLIALALFCSSATASAQQGSLDTRLRGFDVQTARASPSEVELIEAEVGEEARIAAITLFYRFDGETVYRQMPMQRSEEDGVYNASVPTVGVYSSRLEFYIAAVEITGEELLKGSAANPLVRELAPRPARQAASTEPPLPTRGDTGTTPSSRYKYLYYAAGILAIGLVAGAVSGGDGDDSTDADERPCTTAGCPVTIVLPDPG